MVSCFGVGFVEHNVNFNEGVRRRQLASGDVGQCWCE